MDRRFAAEPAWDGSPAPKPGESVLFIHAEQGIGDTIQFARFIPAASTRGWKIELEVHPRLLRLMSLAPALADVKIIATAAADQVPRHDAHIALLSLPHALKISDPASVELSTPLKFEIDPELRATWKERVDGAARPGTLKVGLAWSGNPKHPDDHRRSLQLKSLIPLDHPDVSIFNLQFGPNAPGASGANPAIKLIDLTGHSQDFADTAALIEQLDLVITADTAIAHLAGSIGKPTWVLLYFLPDWRWGLRGDDSAWYPSMRVFRQLERGVWNHPVNAAAEAMAELVRSRGS
jgi:hypothetical protein